MPDRIEDSFKDLLASLQTLKFYGNEHPIFKKSVDKAYQSLQGALATREELVVGIVGEELALEKEILFDLSKSVRPTIMYLKDRGIEKIVFYRGVQKEELEKFITFLAMPKEEIKKEAQDYLSLMGIKNIAAGKLKIATAGAPSSPGSFVIPRQFLSNLKFLYEDSLNKVSDSLTGILNSQEVEAATLRFSMHNIMESLQTNYQEFLKLTTLKRYSLETYVHLLNVSILAMHFSSKIGFNKDDVLDIGIAALFHDTGKLYISRRVLGKKDRLTEEEFSQIKSHTVLGAEILLKYVESFGILPVVVSFEHHLKFDMTGYPKIPFLQKPHIASLIVSIC
ncbi:MAG: HD domain-containing protein, partial [Candidatus Omnitrophica bacterium]|nr:HD domain-containing protein [Candidatus Omnitrophota bacterium]